MTHPFMVLDGASQHKGCEIDLQVYIYSRECINNKSARDKAMVSRDCRKLKKEKEKKKRENAPLV